MSLVNDELRGPRDHAAQQRDRAGRMCASSHGALAGCREYHARQSSIDEHRHRQSGSGEADDSDVCFRQACARSERSRADPKASFRFRRYETKRRNRELYWAPMVGGGCSYPSWR